MSSQKLTQIKEKLIHEKRKRKVEIAYTDDPRKRQQILKHYIETHIDPDDSSRAWFDQLLKVNNTPYRYTNTSCMVFRLICKRIQKQVIKNIKDEQLMINLAVEHHSAGSISYNLTQCLIHALRYQHYEIVNQLLSINRCDFNLGLYEAVATYNDKDMVDFMISHGATVLSDGIRAAINSCNLDMIPYILSKSANINTQASLHMAVVSQSKRALEMLINYNQVLPTASDLDRLFIAQSNKPSIDFIKYLLSKGLKFDDSHIQRAIINEHYEAAALLLNHNHQGQSSINISHYVLNKRQGLFKWKILQLLNYGCPIVYQNATEPIISKHKRKLMKIHEVINETMYENTDIYDKNLCSLITSYLPYDI